MTSTEDTLLSRLETLSCDSIRIASLAMNSCIKHRENESKTLNETELSYFGTPSPGLTIINAKGQQCPAQVNYSDANDMLNYMCEICPLSNDTRVTEAWEHGVCESPSNTGFNVAVFCFYVAILLAAVVGNTLVVFVVGGTAKMRTVTNYFILNLAVGDLLMAIFCIPFTFATTVILQYWPFGAEMCIAVNYLQGVTVFVSAYSLVAISIDRYLAIIYPLRPRMTRLQARVIIWLVWVLALITTAPLAVFSKLFEPKGNYYKVYNLKVCMEDWGDAVEEQAVYSAVLMFLQYILPVTVLVFTYTRICLVVWGKKALGETPARHDRIARSKRKTPSLNNGMKAEPQPPSLFELINLISAGQVRYVVPVLRFI